ncbi:basic leucine zipper transcriptional factor ATF-like 3 isoform X7 [Macaca fascicularis]|uniref:basic leucine zipper transcriptional factor ATF-like 3 isoform X7 n=1 Tax=Macaca fascicularis TaxID=9541 RepID=UPI001E256125|nr:basic leucine zipper transcriptional factor ATF-like 3 isoform X6 [Macaca fascicularis]
MAPPWPPPTGASLRVGGLRVPSGVSEPPRDFHEARGAGGKSQQGWIWDPEVRREGGQRRKRGGGGRRRAGQKWDGKDRCRDWRAGTPGPRAEELGEREARGGGAGAGPWVRHEDARGGTAPVGSPVGRARWRAGPEERPACRKGSRPPAASCRGASRRRGTSRSRSRSRRALRMMTGKSEGEKKTELLLREVGRSRPRRLTSSMRRLNLLICSPSISSQH